MIMPRIALIAAWLAIFPVVGSLPAQPSLERGIYFRSEEPEFEIWIPRGLKRRPGVSSRDAIYAMFEGRAQGGVVQIWFRKMGRINDLPTFAAAVKSSFEGYEGCSCQIHEGEKAGVHDAAIVHARNLEATEDYKGCELLRAGIDTGRELIYITVRLVKGRAEEALKLLRAMLVTFKLSGPDSLDPFLTNRRLDQATGLSFRLPRGFERRAEAKPSRAILASVNASTGARLTLVPSPEAEIEEALEACAKGLKRLGRSWTFPHPKDRRAVGGLYEIEGKAEARVVVAAECAKGHVFILEVAGPLNDRDALIRTAELSAMGLDYVDVAAARAAVDAAAPALEAARRKRKQAEMKAELEVLSRYPFLDQAASGLAKCITKINDRETQVKVARALAGAECGSILPDLIKDIRYFERKKQPDVVAALLTALGSVRGPRAVPVLFKFARRGTRTEAGAAIRSLGRYEIRKDRIVKDLVSLMDKAESRAAKANDEARERWHVIKPAFRSALQRLTGQQFDTAVQAEAWLKSR
jgi:hypothetical protein